MGTASGSAPSAELEVETLSAENDADLRPKIINISLTERCTAACSMCATSSHPGRRGTEVCVKSAEKWIADAVNCSGVIAICFIGGEPFLLRDALLCLTRKARNSGFLVSVVTNCFWAKTRSHARKVLEPLRKAGLTRITVSTDSFHSPYVTERTVDNAIGAAHDLNLRCNLNVVQGTDADELALVLGRLENSSFLDQALSFSCQPVGGAAGMDVVGKTSIPSERCHLVVSTLTIKSNGDAYACCGVGGFTNPLNIGNVNELHLSAIVEKARNDLLVLALALRGPGWLMSLAGNFSPRTKGYTDICHLCNDMLRRTDCCESIQGTLSQHARSLEADATVLRMTSQK